MGPWESNNSDLVTFGAMPRFLDDYSNTYLTHDSAAGRKQQRRGWKFRENFKVCKYLCFTIIFPLFMSAYLLFITIISYTMKNISMNGDQDLWVLHLLSKHT